MTVKERRAAIRKVIAGMFPVGFDVDKLPPEGRAEVREGIDAVLALYDELTK